MSLSLKTLGQAEDNDLSGVKKKKNRNSQGSIAFLITAKKYNSKKAQEDFSDLVLLMLKDIPARRDELEVVWFKYCANILTWHAAYPNQLSDAPLHTID